MNARKDPRPVTTALLTELMAWTRTADMFRSSPEGEVFGAELREVFKLAAERRGEIEENERQAELRRSK